jgi:1-acyl-sn-glycerol-3-phosphate acyltransferase
VPPRNDLPEHRRSVHIMQMVNRWFTRLYHRLDVLAPCRLPKTGAAIIVCNHTSGLDPHLIQACCRRLITWMMAKEYYDQRSVNYLLRELGVIPVTRSGRDMAAMRAAMRALENGQLLGIFPEGRIENSRELMPFQTGVALMAMKMRVPVYAACLDGDQRDTTMLQAFFKPHHARIIFGGEVHFDRSDQGREGLERATAVIKSAVESLRNEMDKRCHSRGL